MKKSLGLFSIIVLATLLAGCVSTEARSTKAAVQSPRKSNYRQVEPAQITLPEASFLAKFRVYQANANAIIELSNQRIFVDPPKDGVYHALYIDYGNKGPEYQLDMESISLNTADGHSFRPTISFLSVNWRPTLREHIHFNPAASGQNKPYIETIPAKSGGILTIWFALPKDNQDVTSLTAFGSEFAVNEKK